MKTIRRAILAGVAAVLALASCTNDKNPYPGLSDAEIDRRVNEILAQLSIEEKTSLMMNNSAAIEKFGIKQYNWWNEALHGVGRNGSVTVFPQPVGMAAAFDEELLYDVFTAVSDEARVKNAIAKREGEIDIYEGLTFWTPNINIFRDPRWGRGMETYGEDPYLTGRLGMAVVRGLQGPDDSPIRKLHACAKHFAVHSGPESTRHSYDAEVSERDLRETYLPAFKDLVTKAHVEEVMTAYNRFRGEPCGASDYLMTDILRDEWGFEGLVTSDCYALSDFYVPGRHGVAENAVEATAMAVKAGVNTECGSVYRNIPAAVEQGLITVEDVDKNLRRLLSARFRLGEMDDINPWSYLPDDIVEGPEHKALSRKIATESLVLLQNRSNVLPLREGQKIAVVGPNANDAEMMWGNYNPIPKSSVTLLEALKSMVAEENLKYVKGCGVMDIQYQPAPSFAARFLEMSEDEIKKAAERFAINVSDMLQYAQRDLALRETFAPALDVESVLAELEGYETVIFAGGISPRLEGEEMSVHLPGFSGGDRTDIELPEVQRILLKALHDAGKKVILVNFSGSAIGLVPETESCDAILQAWYPGQEGGTAIAEVLFGRTSPSGKLPVTFYKSVDQLPDFENYDMAGHTYRFMTEEPLFPFGYGLSYSSFEYGQAKVKKGRISVSVKNTGTMDADEVVQLYVSKPDDTLSPIRTLRDFQRVSIPAGKTVKVSFDLDGETFTWWDESAQDMVPLRGDYKLEIGSSSRASDLQAVSYRY